MTAVDAVPVLSTGAGRYLHWGVVSISVTNFLIIVAMVVLFVLAIVVPFPGGSREPERQQEDRP